MLLDIQNAGVYLHGSFWAVKERDGGRKGETDRERGSGGVQGRSLTLQESQIASGSKYPPLFLPFPPPRLPLSFLPFIPRSLDFCYFFSSTPQLFSVFVFILALVAVGPAGRHGTG